MTKSSKSLSCKVVIYKWFYLLTEVYLLRQNVKLASLKPNSSKRELFQFGLHCMYRTYDWLDSINDRQRMQRKTTGTGYSL